MRAIWVGFGVFVGRRKDSAEKATEGVGVEITTTGRVVFLEDWVKKRRGTITASVIKNPKPTRGTTLVCGGETGGGTTGGCPMGGRIELSVILIVWIILGKKSIIILLLLFSYPICQAVTT